MPGRAHVSEEMRMIRIAIPAVAVPLALSSIACAEQVVNGSFEVPVVPAGPFIPVQSGDPLITGWSVTSAPNTGVDLVNAVGAGDPNWAHGGVQAIDMSGTPGPGILSQDVATTVIQEYTLSFWVSSNVGPWTGGMTIYWDGVFVDTISSPAFGTWTSFSYQVFGAPGPTTTLDFVSNISGFAGVMLDEVSVVPVPAPSAAAVLLAGTVAATRRRRR